VATLTRAVHLSLAAALLLATAQTISACGGGQAGGSAKAATLVVSAAASLKAPLERYAERLRRTAGVTVRYSFAGSDQLAAQIEAGLRPDVFASANLELPRRLRSRGLVQRPLAFAANRLVLAVPAGASKVRSLADLRLHGVAVAVGSATVPVGEYTRTLVSRLPAALRRALRADIRDEEPDASGIVAKLAEGAVDAGFVYASDVKSAGGRLRALPLPPNLAPPVVYAVAVIRGTGHGAQASAFVRGLAHGAGQQALARSGFLPPPPR